MTAWFRKLFYQTIELPPAPPIPKPKQFSTPVNMGYVDDAGVWYADKDDADYASAERYLISAINMATINGRSGQWFDSNAFSLSLRQPDTMRAMAILSGEYCDD